MRLSRRMVFAALVVAGAGVAALLQVGDDPESATSAPPPTTAVVAPALGDLDDRLARLPAVAPGELEGRLLLSGLPSCPKEMALDTLAVTPGDADGWCAEVGRRNSDGFPAAIDFVDMTGAVTRTVEIPEGWDWGQTLADAGVVLCNGSDAGLLAPNAGPVRRLPSCPLAWDGDRLLFATPGTRRIVDGSGTLVVELRRPLGDRGLVPVGSDLLAASAGGESDLYRAGVFVRTLSAMVLSASRDGAVAFVRAEGDEGPATLRMMRDGEADGPQLNEALGPFVVTDDSTRSAGAWPSPDGSRIAVQHGVDWLLILDAATLRPLARLPLPDRSVVLGWR